MQSARLATAVFGGLALMFAVAGCSSPDQKAASNGDASSSKPQASAAASSASSGQQGAAPKSISEHQVIDDPVMGDHIVVNNLVRDFPTPASMSAVSDQEIVLIKVTATAGNKYYAGWDTSSLTIVTPSGSPNPQTETDDLDTAMTKAGYKPFPETGEVHTGKTASGWVSFVVDPKNSAKLTLQMKRDAATTSDGKNISEKVFSVQLT